MDTFNENLETLITREDFLVDYFDFEEEPYGCFSNWYMAGFSLGNYHYNCVEQYIMYQKAITFRRYESSRAIMEAKTAKEANEIADKNHMPLKENELKVWHGIRRCVVKRGVRAKFLQNPEMIKTLLSTGNKIIAECSKNDDIWGIGIDITDPARLDANGWKGDNLMGEILMELRTEFRHNIMLSPNYQIAHEDALFKKPFFEWNLKAGELAKHPAYRESIEAYANTLISDDIRNGFYNTTLSDIEIVITTNLGGGYPTAGFFELKQDIFDISFYINKYID